MGVDTIVTHEDAATGDDDGNPAHVQPSQWNKNHVVVLADMLKALAKATPAPDKGVYLVDANNGGTFDFSAFMRSIMGNANGPALLAAIGAVPLAGGTMTGALTLSADPVASLHAATRRYVDNVLTGWKPKQSVRLAVTTNISISSAPAMIDSVTPNNGDRIGLLGETAAATNGVYIYNGAGAAMTRAADFDDWADIPGAQFLVEEGTLNHDSGWVCTSNQGGTLGSTAIAFSQFFGTGLFQPAAANLTTLAALSSIANLSTLAALSSVANLSALAGLTGAADKIEYFTGVGAMALADFTSFARTLTACANAAAVLAALGVAANPKVMIPFIVDGSGSAIATGIKGDIGPFAYDITITKWTLLADQSGSIVWDLWVDTYANYPPTIADTITASDKPTITTATKAQGSSLTGWSVTLAAGKTMRFNIDSCTTITRCELMLEGTRSIAT